MLRHGILLLLLLSLGGLQAQEFSGGFKAGLNLNTINGPAESMNGDELEVIGNTTGFHVGAIMGLAITDLFGLKAELMYSQAGAEYLFNGPSFFYFYTDANQIDIQPGTRRSEYSVTNSYLTIPLMVYGRLGRLEVEGGVSGSFLVGSVAGGGTNFIAADGSTYRVGYDFNYLRDEAGRASLLTDNGQLPNSLLISPSSIGAYYDSPSDESLYKRLDYGLVGGLSYFINRGLFLGGRVYYGLADVTRSEQDYSLIQLEQNERVARDDDDRNFSLQLSIGFRF